MEQAAANAKPSTTSAVLEMRCITSALGGFQARVDFVERTLEHRPMHRLRRAGQLCPHARAIELEPRPAHPPLSLFVRQIGRRRRDLSLTIGLLRLDGLTLPATGHTAILSIGRGRK